MSLNLLQSSIKECLIGDRSMLMNILTNGSTKIIGKIIMLILRKNVMLKYVFTS